MSTCQDHPPVPSLVLRVGLLGDAGISQAAIAAIVEVLSRIAKAAQTVLDQSKIQRLSLYGGERPLIHLIGNLSVDGDLEIYRAERTVVLQQTDVLIVVGHEVIHSNEDSLFLRDKPTIVIDPTGEPIRIPADVEDLISRLLSPPEKADISLLNITSEISTNEYQERPRSGVHEEVDKKCENPDRERREDQKEQARRQKHRERQRKALEIFLAESRPRKRQEVKIPNSPRLRSTNLNRLLTAQGWADNLASHYAVLYRCSYRLTYFLAACAVLAAYQGSIAEHADLHKFYLIYEFSIIVLIGIVTLLGWTMQWHERWLDYRYLAENLRILHTLTLFGRKIPFSQPPPHLEQDDPRKSWFHWYLGAIMREIGPVEVPDNEEYRQDFRNLLFARIRSQKCYHRDKSKRSEIIHEFGHGAAGLLFLIAAVACLAHFRIHGPNLDPKVLLLNLAVIVLPAFGSAIAAILHHGESKRLARRSESLGVRLKKLERDLLNLGDTPQQKDLARLTDEFASVCAPELMDWRVLFLDRPLTLPA